MDKLALLILSRWFPVSLDDVSYFSVLVDNFVSCTTKIASSTASVGWHEGICLQTNMWRGFLGANLVTAHRWNVVPVVSQVSYLKVTTNAWGRKRWKIIVFFRRWSWISVVGILVLKRERTFEKIWLLSSSPLSLYCHGGAFATNHG